MVFYLATLENNKDNINKFFFNFLIIFFIKKLSYKNTDKKIEKLLKIIKDIPKISSLNLNNIIDIIR